MKNPINFKSILAYSICISGILILSSSCSENGTKDSKVVAEQENIDKLSSDDQTAVVLDNNSATMFLMEVSEMQMEEISLGKLAQQKGNTSQVKELGKMMEAEHSRSLTELSDLAQSKTISIPATLTEDSMDVYQKLEAKTGNDFDRAYCKMMVEHHENAIELFEKASTQSEDSEIKTWAAQKLPGLRIHLKRAQECKEKSDKMKS
jgi:putative membrane protein